MTLHSIDHSWTLFLDRDGVINRNKDESYVFNKEEFVFLDGAKEAISQLSKVFGQIIVITNQRGIGKGLMSDADLSVIHEHMILEIEDADGRIDAVYYCPVDDAKHFDRKPNPGMLLEASHMFPQSDFSKSIMAGDKLSDMQLGRNAGTFTVLITSTQSGDIVHHPDIDLTCVSLSEFAEKVKG
jgi:histidinol-phosphate phosphatase family protein